MLRSAATTTTPILLKRGLVFSPSARSAAPLLLQSRTYVGETSSLKGKLGDRQRGLEEKAVREHDAEVMRKFRESLGLSEDELIPEHVVENKTKELKGKKPEDKDVVSTKDFLAFRKEVITKIRHLEDELMELKIRNQD